MLYGVTNGGVVVIACVYAYACVLVQLTLRDVLNIKLGLFGGHFEVGTFWAACTGNHMSCALNVAAYHHVALTHRLVQ